ncbi:MAG: hypothetical protein J1F24_03205 [Oscillospiraceae bacterium]|nr:hypothetical protein [Oscillospiraceae bacterium]
MEKTKYEQLREKHPSFIYKNYSLEERGGEILIRYDFSMENGVDFHPEIKIPTENLNIVNPFDSECAKRIIFSLGMVELISYWKCACPPKVYVDCGYLDSFDIKWWKRLYFGGLGEFHYINGISADEESFMDIVCRYDHKHYHPFEYNSTGKNLITVGGGKDSAVTTDLLKDFKNDNIFFTVNDQEARTQTVLKAGYSEDRIVKTYRTIDKNLLKLNSEGYLNGHTPFSAIVAFLSLYCAYLTGAENIVLSNESSANESNIKGSKVNHQYSKSFAFEEDFRKYVEKNIMNEINYFSLLRPFNELQIAKYFAKCKEFLPVFRSCNKGSKQNIWCGKCAKCLFVFIMLSPFIEYSKLVEIFGNDMLNDEDLTEDFDGLVGITSVKPFECVGTPEEICLALYLLDKKTEVEKPLLLRRFNEKADKSKIDLSLLKSYNAAHNIPDKFLPQMMEMYSYVAEDN